MIVEGRDGVDGSLGFHNTKRQSHHRPSFPSPVLLTYVAVLTSQNQPVANPSNTLSNSNPALPRDPAASGRAF